MKKLVVVRSVLRQRTDRCTVLISAGAKCGRGGEKGSLSRYCSKSATASRSFSNSNGSYAFFLRCPPACISYIHISDHKLEVSAYSSYYTRLPFCPEDAF